MNLKNASYLSYAGTPVREAWLNNNLVWSAGSVWIGLGSDDNWTTPANWINSAAPTSFSSLYFAGTTRLSAYNDFALDTPFNGITFNVSSGSFQLSGNRFLLNSKEISNKSPNPQTINNDIKLSNGTNIFDTSAGDITFNGLLSGIGSVSKTGTGLIKLSAAKTIFTGSVNVSGGTLQIDNSIDLMGTIPSVYNLNGSGAYLNLNSSSGRLFFNSKNANFGSSGNQTLNIAGNILANGSTFTTNGGLKNYFSGAVGSNFLNGQFTTITYNVADGTDDIDLEVSAYLYNHAVTKTGAGKMTATTIVLGISNPLTIASGTFEVGTGSSFQTNFAGATTSSISNNGTLSYASNINSNCVNYSISGTGNLIKSGTSTLTLSSARCTYGGSTSITNGSIVTTRDTATATFTPTTLTVNFTSPPNVGDAFKFFPGTTVQTYASVSLIGAPGRTASYNSATSTLSTIS